jgi:hypothetical protein
MLAACASTQTVEIDVQAFAKWPSAVAPSAASVAGSYRFERLPSQDANEAAQLAVESALRAALTKVDLTQLGGSTPAANTAAPAPTRYTVQASSRTVRHDTNAGPFSATLSGPFWGWAGRDYVVNRLGQVIWLAPPSRLQDSLYIREVSVLVRDAVSNQVVFESHAKHDSRWNNGAELLPTMFDAALKDFPSPPTGLRSVTAVVPLR